MPYLDKISFAYYNINVPNKKYVHTVCGVNIF